MTNLTNVDTDAKISDPMSTVANTEPQMYNLALCLDKV